jgi:hypothetical protein
MQVIKATTAAIARCVHSGFEQTFIGPDCLSIIGSGAEVRATRFQHTFERLRLLKDAARDASSPSPVNLVRRKGRDRIGKEGSA